MNASSSVPLPTVSTSDMIVAAYEPSGFLNENISNSFSSFLWAPPFGVDEENFRFHVEKWTSLVADGSIFNGEKYALRGFNVSHDLFNGPPKLFLEFTVSDYVSRMATAACFDDLSVDDKKRHVANYTPGFPGDYSSTFGIMIAVVSSDGKLLFTRRSLRSAVNTGFWIASCSEGLSVEDFNEKGVLDLYGCAWRGLNEELGIERSSSIEALLKISMLTGDTSDWTWGMLGVLDLSHTPGFEADVLKSKAESSVDGWELDQVMTVDLVPEMVGSFLAQFPVTQHTEVVCALALVDVAGFSWKEINVAFHNAKKTRFVV